MSLDPNFSVKPITPAPAGYWTSDRAIREDIASMEEDVKDWQKWLQYNLQEIPRLERESLKYQLDIAQTQLKIYELKAKLAAKEGVA